MQSEKQPYVAVYQVLEEVSGRAVPAGAPGSMFAAIDSLRQEAAPVEAIRTAERIAVAVHKLEWALRKSDADEEAAVREELRSLSALWSHSPVPLAKH